MSDSGFTALVHLFCISFFPDAVYHAIVQAQVMLLVSFVLTVACLVLQYRKNKCKSLSAMVLITAASMSCLVLAGKIKTYVLYIHVFRKMLNIIQLFPIYI